MKPPEAGAESWTAWELWELTMRCLYTPCSGESRHFHCSVECLSEQGYPLPLVMLSCSCGYLLEWGTQQGAALLVSLCWSRPCVGKQGLLTLCWGSGWELSTPVPSGTSTVTLWQQGELPATTHLQCPKQWCHLTFKIRVRRKLVSCLAFVLTNVLFSYSLVTTINS